MSDPTRTLFRDICHSDPERLLQNIVKCCSFFLCDRQLWLLICSKNVFLFNGKYLIFKKKQLYPYNIMYT